MPKSASRWRFAAVTVLAVVAVGLVALHLHYPLPYIYRVFVYRDADFADIHRFPANAIAASDAPAPLLEASPSRQAEVAATVEQHPDVERLEALIEETDTTAFLIVHDGRLVLERYANGHDRDSLQNTFSVSKSFASALVGLAVRDGALSLDDPITRHLPELAERDERFNEITIEHLIDMRSGIRFDDDVKFPIINQDNPLIYYSPDLERVVLERTTITSPPGEFRYNNYNPPLVGLTLHRLTGMSASAYLEREIWQPMGAAYEAGWTTDDHGRERMESGLHARAVDLARFGMLYLDGGRADGCRLVPENWVEGSTELRKPAELDRYDGRSWGYRAGWWIVPRPEGRSDYCAIGRFGQFIYISPQHDAVFVRNGPDRGEWGDRDWTALFYFVAERL